MVVARSYVQHTVCMCRRGTTPSSGVLAVQGQRGCVRSSHSCENDVTNFYNGLNMTRHGETTIGGHLMHGNNDAKIKIKTMLHG